MQPRPTRTSSRSALTPVLLALAAVTACTAVPEYDVVLEGGRVMDPASGTDSILTVGILNGRIEALAEGPLRGKTVVDVSGQVVAPGFIDLHAHGQTPGDMALQAQDGVTTALELEVGVYPVAPWYAAHEGKTRLNFGATVGHIPARFAVFHQIEVGHWPTNSAVAAAAGAEPAGTNAEASAAQLETMTGAIRAGLDEGALGVGFGINYTPGATAAEIERLFGVAAERAVPVYVHTRAFGIGAIREALAATATTAGALHIVHIGSSAGADLATALAAIDSARATGRDVTTEVYPYTAASTLLESALFNPGWQSNLGIDYGDLAWALTGERLTRESFDRYRAQGGWVIIYMMKDENIERAIAHPGVMIASDGVPFVNGTGHPRGAGTFARVLGHYVREKQLLPLMEALAKMTLLPAQRVEGVAPAMRNKGRIRIGADADLTVFDPATIIDRATFQAPTQPSAGISNVLVNGVFVVRDGALVPDVTPGRAIRAGRE